MNFLSSLFPEGSTTKRRSHAAPLRKTLTNRSNLDIAADHPAAPASPTTIQHQQIINRLTRNKPNQPPTIIHHTNHHNTPLLAQ